MQQGEQPDERLVPVHVSPLLQRRNSSRWSGQLDVPRRPSVLAKQEFWIEQVNALFAYYAPGGLNG